MHKYVPSIRQNSLNKSNFFSKANLEIYCFFEIATKRKRLKESRIKIPIKRWVAVAI